MRLTTPAKIGALCFAVLLSGCVSTTPTIDVDSNEPVTPVAITTYTLMIEQMPGFLVPYFRDELVAALAARGATEVAADGDAGFVLRFEQVALGAESLPRDDLGEKTATEERTRFMARVELLVRPRGAADAIRVGSLSRVHAITTGAYMHQGARGPIRQGFDQLLAPLILPR